MLIEWTKEFEICEIIDAQHKKLFDIINNFFNEYLYAEKNSVQKAIEELEKYTHFHFETEEKLFKKYEYQLTNNHIKEHRDFEKEIKSFAKRYKKKDSSLSNNIIVFLKEWLVNHILITDMKFKNKICN